MRIHTLLMILGCALPLLLIFILPVLGVRSNLSIFFLIVLIFVGHLFMLSALGDHEDHEGTTRGEGHGDHKKV